MRNNQQYEQLMMQYKQLSVGSDEILRLINIEDFDSAITMIKSRESLFLSCKCMLKFLELTENQQKEVDTIVNEIRNKEKRNIDILQERMDGIKTELTKTRKTEKILRAYDIGKNNPGGIINLQE
ncbi:flagellar protein FliT [bacterium]|nr:flagellar protein FliT [bacterium]